MNIFEDKTTMAGAQADKPVVVLMSPETPSEQMQARIPQPNKDVVNVTRPMRGHHY